MSVIANDFAQAPAGFLENCVTDGMPERIVDALEAVQIDAQHADDLALLRCAADVLHVLLKQQPVGEVGQRIVPGQVLDARLIAALLGDVFVSCHPAPIGERLMADRNGASIHHFDDVGGGLLGHHRQAALAKALPPPMGSLPACNRWSSISSSDIPM